MADTLTDEQVAALTDAWVQSNCTMAHGDVADEPATIDVGRHETLGASDVVQRLAIEVQQARARRCGNCAQRDTLCFDSPGPDWFCADFVTQEPQP